MHLQEEIGPPELGDGCISIPLIDSMLEWSLGILDCVYPWDFLSKKWKAPLQLICHPIHKIVPWRPYFDNEPIGAGFCHLDEMWIVCGSPNLSNLGLVDSSS